MKSLPITDIDINEDGNISFKQGGLSFNCSALAISGSTPVTQCKPINNVYSAYSDISKGVYYVNNTTNTGSLSFKSTCGGSSCSDKVPKLPGSFPSKIIGLVVANNFVSISTNNDGLYVYSDNPAFTALHISNAPSDIAGMYYDEYENELILESEGKYYQCDSTTNALSAFSCKQINSASICGSFSTISEISSNSKSFTQAFYQYNKENSSGSYDGDSYGPTLNATPVYVGAINAARSIPEICANNATFLQQRVVDTARYITTLKFNYCHHHIPYEEAPSLQQQNNNDGKHCSGADNIYPGSLTFGKEARWNYVVQDGDKVNYTSINDDGIISTSTVPASASDLQSLINDSETDWQNKGMWYGIDCSDFTLLVYNYALGNRFSPDISEQAGQQLRLSGNSELNVTSVAQDPQYDAFGEFLCSNGEIAQKGNCSNGSLISTWLTSKKNEKAITPNILNQLEPGDLLYIAADKDSALVTHTVIWSGLKIGGGADDIPAKLIAPNGICKLKNDWGPVAGDWVIMDSTYQGPDLRKYMPDCFYGPSIWAAKRIINIGTSTNQYPYTSINNVLINY
jgi:hypothetical protein